MKSFGAFGRIGAYLTLACFSQHNYMKFKYTIRGRLAGKPHGDTFYDGEVNANTASDALILALADQFGDPDDGSPTDQLVDSGWCDLFDLQCAVDDVDDQKSVNNVEFDNGDSAFDIEIKLVDEAVPKVGDVW